MSEQTLLVIGYGNPARGDDALGPLVIDQLASRNRQPVDCWRLVTLAEFQLQVENVLDIAGHDAVLFVDASVSGEVPWHFTRVGARRDDSYTSHAMTPQALLAAYEPYFSVPPPPCYLLTISGEAFDLGEDLSASACEHLLAAQGLIETLLSHRLEYWNRRLSESA